MKVIILALILSTLATPALALNRKINGIWVLNHQVCRASSLVEQFKARALRTDRVSIRDHVMILGADGSVRKVDKQGQIFAEGDYVLSHQSELLIRSEGVKGFEQMPGRIKIEQMNSRGMTATYSSPKCPNGKLVLEYMKIRSIFESGSAYRQ